jgi:serine/threonine-protein kinase
MSPGCSIAHYRIVGKLGEGGMGAVYRATDTKLNRDVAIKILPPTLATDAARMQRFEREAQVLASLNHPNIAAIYGVEEGAIVMELVDGEDLRGPLAIDTAIQYARQIVAGLEAAHEKGIIHRDLKPANIKVTPDGQVKLLDFGLAKATEESTSTTAVSPTFLATISMAMTQAGMIVGTAAYMSPEQARGKPVDRRADIWAFGVVFFEMLTGQQMFASGDNVTDILAAVVTREPDWSALPNDTPPHVRRLLERCLRKDVKTRLQAIGEGRIALDEPPPLAAETPAPALQAPRPRRWPWIAGIATAALLGLAAGEGWYAARRAPLHPLIRLNVDLGDDSTLYYGRGYSSFDISPDGTRLALVLERGKLRSSSTAVGDSPSMLGIRLLHEEQVSLLNGTEGARSPFFSPDGDWIGFIADGKLKKVAVTGGAPLTLCSLPRARGANWAEESSIVVAIGNGRLQTVSSAGGTPAELTKFDTNESHSWPQFLPENKLVLYTASPGFSITENAQIVAQSTKSGARAVVVHGGHAGRYLPSGHLLFVRDGTLYAARFDAGRMSLAGPPVPLLEGMRDDLGAGGALYSASQTGLLVFASAPRNIRKDVLVWLDEAGKQKELHNTPGWYMHPRLSPDNRRLAFSVYTNSGAGDIWVKDFEHDSVSRLTSTAGLNNHPAWTPDGAAIFYKNVGPASGLYWIPADGSGPAQRLTEGSESPRSFTPDGKRLAFSMTGDGIDVYTAAVEGDATHRRLGKPEKFVATPAVEVEPQFSPDGKWIAYVSNESGRSEVYVRPFPGPGGYWQISTDGGDYSRWGPKGHVLFYESAQAVMAVAYTISGNAFVYEKPRLWAPIHPSGGGGDYQWDISADGKRLVIVKGAADEPAKEKPQTELTFLLNFTDELKRRVK